MDQNYRHLVGEIFIRWIMGNQKKYVEDGVKVAHIKSNRDRYVISFESSEKYGTITFWCKNCIMEEQLYSKKNNSSIFYLHYEIDSIGQCHHLFLEFYSCLIKKSAKRRFRVLISCTTGITSCIFATKMQELADLKDVNIRVDATGFENMKKVYETYDVLLLAPQLGHKKAEILKSTNSLIAVHRINAGEYGMMKIENTYNMVYQLGKEKQLITN